GGRKVAPQLQRMKSEDLLAAVFPDQVACAENLAGAREIPDHPLVAQTLQDCLYEAMDAAGWLRLLAKLESGEIEVLARDVPAPSALAAEALNARPDAFLDDAPLEERRTQAVQNRRYVDPESADDLGQLDAEAIEAVRQEAWPRARSADEMHEALHGLGVVSDAEALANAGWQDWLQALAADRRATRLAVATAPGRGLWVAAERWAQVRTLYPGAAMAPEIEPPCDAAPPADADDVLRELLRSRLGGLGPVSAPALAASLGLPAADIEAALGALQTEGSVLQGRFTPGTPALEWCERHLLARIHRYTLKRLRQEIEPVEPRDFARFLFEWQRVAAASRVSGPEALAGILAQLEGYEAPAGLWEAELLPARVKDYAPAWLDELCTAGRTLWTRLRPLAIEGRPGGGSPSLRSAPILLLPRRSAALWTGLAPAPGNDDGLGSRARRLAAFLAEHGASFFDEMVQGTHLLGTELEDALSELVMRGRVHCDSYAGLRALLIPPSKRSTSTHGRRHRRTALFGIEDAGRWSLVRARAPAAVADSPARVDSDAVEQVARVLLRRYGVVCWRLLEREAAWLPPWRDLVRAYRRLEARGEIRGGRFIAGVAGEQFALPEAIGLLRETRRRPLDGALVCLSAADPANLLGTIMPGPKAARVAGSRVLYRDGVPIASLVAGQVELLQALAPSLAQAAQRALMSEAPSRVAELVSLASG
ncbi:MAG TPA: ATP-dependent DNA helicase, partial [Variovorax sp.]|nr:ATP-dependent DNA helicase [Variovorax sp.]